MFELKLIKHVLLHGLSKGKLGALSAPLVSFPENKNLIQLQSEQFIFKFYHFFKNQYKNKNNLQKSNNSKVK